MTGSIDDQSICSDSANQRENSTSRDEVEEIRKQSEKETALVSFWRRVVFMALLATAVAVTATTYTLLVKQEHENFETIYHQFARTVAEAALDFQTDLRCGLETMSHSISALAEAAGNGNSPWPSYIPPRYEAYAIDYQKATNAEFIGLTNVVHEEHREEFLNYSAAANMAGIKESHMIRYGHMDFLDTNESLYVPYIMQLGADGFFPDEERDFYVVRNIQSPPPRSFGPPINWNLGGHPGFGRYITAALLAQNETVLTQFQNFIGLPEDEHKGLHAESNEENPHVFGIHPVYMVPGDFESEIVSVLVTAIAFDASMRYLLPENVKGMITVIENKCEGGKTNESLTYRIDGNEAYFVGWGDNHDPKYDDMMVSVDMDLATRNPNLYNYPGSCMYSMRIYPTEAFESDYKSKTPLIFSIVVAVTFIMVALTFLVYDVNVLKRNEKLIRNAAKSNAIVTSFVPDHLRERLLQEQANNINRKSGNLKTFLNDNGSVNGMGKNPSAPLADLFLETTVIYADISGFTAWSSVREPTQVFILLETLYGAFDAIAKKRRVYKVETTGDCYVAVCGLPEPRKEHAVAICRFAQDIISKMRVLTKELEVTLGPDTEELALRIGIHSGPVTAGVLRGERARFQLFGDTINTCSRVEATGQPDRIQCSKETAEQLFKFGKEKWLHKRTEPMPHLKGNGMLETFWVTVDGGKANSVVSANSSVQKNNERTPVTALCTKSLGLDERTTRLVDWNTEMLVKLMQAIAARREEVKSANKQKKSESQSSQFLVANDELSSIGKGTPLEEVREIITLPEFEGGAKQVDPDQIKIPQNVVQELHHLVSSIAKMYNNNPFHNFEHASHVVMSVIKLMSRIVAPSHLLEETSSQGSSDQNVAASLHDHTYGITSDPLTRFAAVFSALIHDVDHVGVSNAQLVKEGVPIASKYGERSVAEQNSLDLSWDLLMRPDYNSLREFLFATPGELVRFRALVVNSVMSTDIVDKDMKELRNNRWDKAFKKGDKCSNVDENPRDEVNRKATIVIEHIIQASDISHAMQHWHVYRKWNQNLFEELYVAYLNGRMEKDPAEFWYKGEMGFFDFYIIPLTKKLKECGVFGVSSGELLDYAQKNREEWEAHGEGVVNMMIKEVRKKYGYKGDDGQVMSEEEQAPMQKDFDV